MVYEVNSPQALALELECISDCKRNHEQCLPLGDASILPTRLIDCRSPANPRLVSMNGERGTYLALSYVWGEPQPHSTTTINLATYLDGIDVSLLPQTIKDAISTTKTLGYQYLWADTLCIIQDSPEDKAIEIAQMPAIYGNAALTIIAASANRVSEGFLQDRFRPTASHRILPVRIPGSTQIGTIHLSPFSMERRDGPTEPVESRAWCLQERFLSPRALVFASQTVEYHCQTAIVNLGHAACDLEVIRQRLPEIVFRPETDLPSELSAEDWGALRVAWSNVLTSYTRRAVTDPADKLVALGGVAAHFHRLRNSRYLAGIWEDTLRDDLLWCTDGEPRARPAGYRAPSWSWAAIDGQVFLHVRDPDQRGGTVQLCKVVRCDVTLAREVLPFGGVTSGTLVLRAPMVRALRGDPDPAAGWRAELHAVATDAPPNSSNRGARIGTALLDCDADDCAREVWAVPMRWNKSEPAVEGLIVVPVSAENGHSGTRYRRVGYFQMQELSLWEPAWFDGVPSTEFVVV